MATLSSSSAKMSKKLMQAIQYSFVSEPAGLKHVEIPVPTPNENEVLLKVEAATLNSDDWEIHKGMIQHLLPLKFPCIPGTAIAGEIVEVGPQVKGFKVGDKVVSNLRHDFGGGLAEFAVAPESLTASRPPEISAAEAAALPVAGLTAHQALTEVAGVKFDGTGEQKNILVTAASSGVGHYAVQLAKLGNTFVTATCGARDIEFVKSLGADEVLDYKTPEGAALKSPSGRKYDVVIHCTTGIQWSTFDPQLSDYGKVIDFLGSITVVLTKLIFAKKQLVPFSPSAKKVNLSYLVQLVKDGKLKTVIDSRFPLSKAEDAWAKSIDGHATGKIIVEP